MGKLKSIPRRRIWIFVVLLTAAFLCRLAVARWLANDAPFDGVVYAQMARNLLEQHVYSHSTTSPYEPSIIRLPGYPLLLAGIYSVFGHYNSPAVRAVQALLDTASCALIALLAYLWEPDPGRKRRSALVALVLATLCPFTAIYVGTILTETPTILLTLTTCVLATIEIG